MNPPRVRAEDVEVGVAPRRFHDVVDVPAGAVHPDDDPHRPDAVLVSSVEQAWETGAVEGGVLAVEVQRAVYAPGARLPSYCLVGRAGSLGVEVDALQRNR